MIYDVIKNDIIICIMYMIVMVNEFRCYGLSMCKKLFDNNYFFSDYYIKIN